MSSPSRMSAARRLRPQVHDQTATTDSESDQRIFQCHDRGQSEQAEGGDRSDVHDPAHSRRNIIDWSGIDQLPDQEHVGRVYQEEDRRVEGYRLRRQFAHGHPGGGQRKQRHGKQMRDVEPDQTRRTANTASENAPRRSGVALARDTIVPFGSEEAASPVARGMGVPPQRRGACLLRATG